MICTRSARYHVLEKVNEDDSDDEDASDDNDDDEENNVDIATPLMAALKEMSKLEEDEDDDEDVVVEHESKVWYMWKRRRKVSKWRCNRQNNNAISSRFISYIQRTCNASIDLHSVS